tara:strand:+ start:142 stop:444 length:303 start_codon:yes stop_codon:yes gene_type:complete
MSIDNLSVKEAANVSLGGVGCFIEDGTTAITGKKIVAIQFLTDTTFTTLTPNNSNYIGTSGGNGDAIDTNNTFPTGLTLFGQFTGFTLATGSVIAYEGVF